MVVVISIMAMIGTISNEYEYDDTDDDNDDDDDDDGQTCVSGAPQAICR